MVRFFFIVTLLLSMILSGSSFVNASAFDMPADGLTIETNHSDDCVILCDQQINCGNSCVVSFFVNENKYTGDSHPVSKKSLFWHVAFELPGRVNTPEPHPPKHLI